MFWGRIHIARSGSISTKSKDNLYGTVPFFLEKINMLSILLKISVNQKNNKFQIL
jgi:hypothetical protein